MKISRKLSASPSESKTDTSGKSLKKAVNRFTMWQKTTILIFVVLFSGVGAYFLQSSEAARPTQTINLSLSPSSDRVTVGSTLSLAVRLDSLSSQVNAVQAVITYPQEYFEFVEIDSANSAFNIDVQADGGGGRIKIAKGSVTPVTGKSLVATVRLRALQTVRAANVEFTSESAVASYVTSEDVLERTFGGSYRIR